MSVVDMVISGIVALWLGSTEWRIRTMQTKLAEQPTREEVDSLISIKQETLRAQQEDIKEDIRRLEAKIDKLIDLQIRLPKI